MAPSIILAEKPKVSAVIDGACIVNAKTSGFGHQ
jgi:hypothetical protein